MKKENGFNIDVCVFSNKHKLTISFLEEYEVFRCGFKGLNKKKLPVNEIKKKIFDPVGSKKIGELVDEKSEVAIVFDDLSRPTDFSEIASIVVEELLKNNVKKENMRFICATGAHGALTINDFIKKLGKRVVAEYPIYNHNPFWGNRFVGETENGIPLYLNEELYKCDVVIGLGTVLPHINMGFSGGGKLIFPGCCGTESIAGLHSIKHKGKMKLWNTHNNFYRRIIDKAGEMCGLNFIINVLLNGKLEITDVFAGDSILAFEEAVKVAREHYDSKLELESDIVVVNVLSRENESFVGQILAAECLKKSGGILVIIAESGLGQVTHYVTGNFGRYFKSKYYVDIDKPEKIKKQIIFSSIPDKSSEDWWLEKNDKIIWAKSWDDVLKVIEKEYPDKAKVTFIQDGGMQYDSRLQIEI